MQEMTTDVIVVGAGPVGAMLAGELGRAGVRPLVLERRARPGTAQKASGLGGRILDVLRYRGLLDRLTAISADASPKPIFPFGGVYLDFTGLDELPLHAMAIPQAEVEELLAENAVDLGAQFRRGHEVVAVAQDDDAVVADVEGPDGPYRVRARYLVGCDGGRSRIRELAGIGFPGSTYPEVNRLAVVAVHESVTVLDDGGIVAPGVGRVEPGFTHTGTGVFALGRVSSEDRVMFFQTTENDDTEYDNDEPLSMVELGDSVRRVLGGEVALGAPTRLSRYQFQDRQAENYRVGRVFLAGDAAHLLPATGAAMNLGMTDSVNLAWKLAADIHGWAPADLLDTYHLERHFVGGRALLQTRAQAALRQGQDPAAQALRAVFGELLADEPALRRMGALVAGTDLRYPMPGTSSLTGTFAPDLILDTDQGTTTVAELMHAARPVFLDLADRADLREIVEKWIPVDIRSAGTVDRPADAILIRPDGHIAWAAAIDESSETATAELSAALTRWFGVQS
ncbi:FAD-dependent monooxygenase [Nocardia alba]|uniref:2-polyprenyl-6-methoxyphenol hydroxylase-like FAD-dependent oxidoreductase n=1 Tax=Nocardia alba TaxID=225051 RepID=A0A4R1FP29_9NOCA|nr:FAD-dependent monooxygenase [Nocardia alba]TCJ95129.1 2-polyprenyl-6-methoxyphenol hydroxylase-like FAD-dependent oxidoreductase [Nocardia alba]